jgi:hypothetical protein
MTLFLLLACILLIISHIIALKILKMWRLRGEELLLGLAVVIFMWNGQLAGFIGGIVSELLFKGGAL